MCVFEKNRKTLQKFKKHENVYKNMKKFINL